MKELFLNSASFRNSPKRRFATYISKSLLYSNRPSSYARLIAAPILAIAASNRSQFTGISIS